MSADILLLDSYRIGEIGHDEIDLETAVEVAVRDLREILSCWGTETARRRAIECESTLRGALSRLSPTQ